MPVLQVSRSQELPLSVGLKSDVFLKTPPRDGSLVSFRDPLAPEELPYYHGTLTGLEAERRLAKTGDFLIRRESGDKDVVLSFRSQDSVQHFSLRQSPDGHLELPPVERAGEGYRPQRVKSVEEYVAYFHLYKFPIMDSFLLNPVSNH